MKFLDNLQVDQVNVQVDLKNPAGPPGPCAEMLDNVQEMLDILQVGLKKLQVDLDPDHISWTLSTLTCRSTWTFCRLTSKILDHVHISCRSTSEILDHLHISCRSTSKKLDLQHFDLKPK